MLLKLSNQEMIPGFNRVMSALIKENNIPISSSEDFGMYFPDQVNPANSCFDFFNKITPLKNSQIFIDTVCKHPIESPICVFGDYDADGITATVILVHALSRLGYTVYFETPNRLEDGYGMNKSAIDRVVNEKGVSLIITVDNGISGKEFVEYAQSLDCDVLVTDHHLPTEGLIPTTAPIIDPKYNGDSFSDICGAFVALKLVYELYVYLNGDLNVIANLAPLAGIATITDMMPMIGENRELVRLTLDAIDNVKYNNRYPLHKILQSLGGANFLRSQNSLATEELIAFYVGPAINAISRVNGDVTPVVQKMIECFERPWAYIPSYISVNYTRQKMSNELLKDFIYDDSFVNSSVFVYDATKYPYNIKGILGLIANKVSNKYKIVSLIGSYKNKDMIEFSGRSTPNYDLHKGIERLKVLHKEFELDGGGHAQAMGIRLKAEYLNEFCIALENDISENSSPYDQHIFEWEEELEEEIVETLGLLQPYGNNFQKLKFQYSGIFFDYDHETKIACIGDYKFKMYIAPTKLEELIGTDMDVIFTISYNSSEGPIFTVLSE